MTRPSRGIVRRHDYVPPPPLTDSQKDTVEAWARRGRRDREIAEHLDVSEYRVTTYRMSLGIKGWGTRGQNQYTYEAKGLRPAHVKGEVGSDEWWASNEHAFQSAVMMAGGW